MATRTQMSTSQSSQLASAFFYAYSWLQMLAIMAVGPAMAVGTISTERERRTIEYLFVTDLSNAEIVVGKAIARLLLLGKLMLVGLPILFIFRLLGGIPVEALLATFLLAGSSALMVTALSICISVWSARSRDAIVRVYLLLVVVVLLPLILTPFGMFAAGKSDLWDYLIEPIVGAMMVINPISALTQALGNRFAAGLGLDMGSVWWSVLWQTVVSVGALVSATLAVRRVHLAESSRGVSKKAVPRSFKLPQWKPRLRSRPMIWKEMFAGTAQTKLGFVGVLAAAIILAVILGLTIYVFLESTTGYGSSSPDNFMQYLTMMTCVLGSGILLLLASRSAGLVTTEIERDCWLSLVATPLTGREIMLGKMWGNLYSVRWALLCLVIVWSFQLWIDPLFFLWIIFMAFAFMIHAWYVTNLGLMFSLQSKTTMRSMGFTLATLIFTAGGYLFCCCVIMSTGGGPDEIMLAPCIPFLLAVPPMFYLDFMSVRSYNTIEDDVLAVYLFGMGAYFVVAALLSVAMTGRFDEFAGRCTAAESFRPRVPGDEQPAA